MRRRRGSGPAGSPRVRRIQPRYRPQLHAARSGVCRRYSSSPPPWLLRTLPFPRVARSTSSASGKSPSPGREDTVSIGLSIFDDGGQVVGDVLDPGGRFILIEEIMMSGPELLLGFRMEFEGQKSQVMIYLLPDEGGLAVRIEGGGGAFTATGRGKARRRPRAS